jgi:hypothetical protein
LGDLLAKDEEEKYVLTEKGKLASRLLLEFPEDNNIRKKPTWWRKFWIAEAIVTPIYLAINIALYFRGYIDATTLYDLTLGVFACIGIGYMITHIKKDVLSAQGLLKLNRALYLLLGLLTGGFLIWGGLTVAMNVTGASFWLKGIIGDGALAITTMIPCYIAGYLLGDWIGKKNKLLHPTLSIKTMCNLNPRLFFEESREFQYSSFSSFWALFVKIVNNQALFDKRDKVWRVRFNTVI